jgi:hypothetical protein
VRTLVLLAVAISTASGWSNAAGESTWTGSHSSMQAMVAAARSCGARQLSVDGPPRYCTSCARTEIWLHLRRASGHREVAARQCLGTWMKTAPQDISLIIRARD